MARITPRKSHLKEGTEILIRSAELSDAPKLLEAVRSVLDDGDGMVMDPDEFGQTEEQEKSWITTFNDHPRELLLVAEAQGQLVGTIGFHVGKRRRLAHSGEFGMSVQPGWRSRGVGNALLESLLEWARSVPEIEKVCLKVRADNARAIALYKKHGFGEIGRAKHATKMAEGVYIDEIAMERFVL
jgi:RimJ/RimL family protein N-acetyltransferase